jgi:uncharacterized DUF497 family protein
MTKFEWDPSKARANLAKHGVSFETVADFDWSRAIEIEDDRFEYGEARTLALGPIKSRLHVLIYTSRGKIVRVISLRLATPRERRDYEKTQAGGS